MTKVTEEQAKKIGTIEGIFEGLKKPQGFQGDWEVFSQQLSEYENQLKNEVEFLGVEYDHPLRAARALQTALKNPSPESFNAFQKAATNSQFYPRTRALASGLLATLVFTAVIALVGVAVFAAIGAPFVMLPLFLAQLSGVSLGVTLPAGGMQSYMKLTSYEKVMQPIKTGDTLAKSLFTLFPPPKSPATATALDPAPSPS